MKVTVSITNEPKIYLKETDFADGFLLVGPELFTRGFFSALTLAGVVDPADARGKPVAGSTCAQKQANTNKFKILEES